VLLSLNRPGHSLRFFPSLISELISNSVITTAGFCSNCLSIQRKPVTGALFQTLKMQIKTFTLALLASLATASAVPKQQFARQVKNETAPVYGAGAKAPGSSNIIAAGTGLASVRYPTARLGTAPANAANGLNISTTFVATVSSRKLATTTQTVQTTLLLANGTRTIAIPATLVVTKTNTVIVYFTQAANGQQLPASTANPVVAVSPSNSMLLSLSQSVSNQVLTYTKGSGSSQTVITTTIKKTQILTLTKTIFATKQTSVTGVTAQAAGASLGSTAGKTRTVTLTTTVFTGTPSKQTGTVQAVGANAGSSNGEAVTVQATGTMTTKIPRPNGSSAALAQSGSVCALAVTSTVVLKSTVFVVSCPNIYVYT
jgi:hypothetical protein